MCIPRLLKYFDDSDSLLQERIELSYQFRLNHDDDIFFSDEEIFQSDQEIFESDNDENDDDDDDINAEYFTNLQQSLLLSYETIHHQHHQQNQQPYSYQHHCESDSDNEDDENFIFLSEKTENILTI